MEYPDDLLYTREHEWVKLDKKTNVVTVGVTDYAQDKLGDVVHVELPEEESELKSEEPFGSIESVKAVSDIYSPVNGKIVEINNVLADSPEVINDDPYGDGWIIKLSIEDEDELVGLMNAQEYEEFIEDEAVED